MQHQRQSTSCKSVELSGDRGTPAFPHHAKHLLDMVAGMQASNTVPVYDFDDRHALFPLMILH